MSRSSGVRALPGARRRGDQDLNSTLHGCVVGGQMLWLPASKCEWIASHVKWKNSKIKNVSRNAFFRSGAESRCPGRKPKLG